MVVAPLAVVVVAPLTVVVVAPFIVVVVVAVANGKIERVSPEYCTGRNRSSAVSPTRLSALARSFTPGQVDDDRVALALHVGLGDAEAVDAVADDVDRGVERR